MVAFRALVIRPLQTGLTRHRFCAGTQPCQSTFEQCLPEKGDGAARWHSDPSHRIRVTVRYEPNQPPTIAATIQKLYGLEESPKIAFGNLSVVVEALAPNQRPQQKTTDMKSFWANSYPLLKKELKGRYPKHEWR